MNKYILISVIYFVFVHSNHAQDLPLKSFESQKDYSYMWWKKTIKTGNQIFAIKTNNYSLAFDYPNLSIQNLNINTNNTTEETVLRETNEASFPSNTSLKFRFGTSLNSNITWCDKTSGIDDDCQLIETGKYFHRRFITNLPDLKDFNKYNSGLEISSWPDRLTFILKVVPEKDLKDVGLITELTFPDQYNELIEKDGVKALKNPLDGSGYIIIKSTEATSISVQGTTVKVNLEAPGMVRKGEEINSGMIIYPIAKNIDLKLYEIAESENLPLTVIANQISPKEKQLDTYYDKDKGWYRIGLRNDMPESANSPEGMGENNFGLQNSENNRMERVQFSINNPTKSDKVVRLNFAKGRLLPEGGHVFAIPAISAVLRDGMGNPVGIPVQLSKNWHEKDYKGIENHYFRGPWYHGLSMLTIPANSSISLEYTSVNALWGGVPAASHAQLSLVGWGHNQQWDESAIGGWGETITYEPDLDQTGAPVLDFRPLLVKTPKGEKWDWTGNLGGADFFDYTKLDGNRGWHSRIRTQYKRYSPNFTEVTYAGTMDDESMDFEYTASIGRSDDLTRGIYRIKLEVLKDVEFKDFSFIQFAAATYHHVKSKNLAWGNETGVKKQWKSTVDNKGPRYTSKKFPAKGKYIWFSFTDSEYTSDQINRFKLAERGFIVRDWKARINGVDNVIPWFAEFNTAGGNYGDPSGIIKIIPPKGCTTFKAGDYIEALVELIIIPSSLEDYYGPNQNFSKALESKANTWKMVHREAVGNDITLSVTIGEPISNYPIKIKTDKNIAEFTVEGGIGYVPLTLTNINSYKNPKLFWKVNGQWQSINQEIHGNDFWQSEYDTASGTWDITFNINLDSVNDKKQILELKFTD